VIPVVTDPVKRIRSFEHDTPLARDLAATLSRLATLPPATEAPYLTVSLDWRPEGTEPGRIPSPEPKRSERRAQRDESGVPRRPSWQQVGRELPELVVAHGPRGAAFDSLSADVARIRQYVEEELDPAAKGVIIVANSHHDVFEPVPVDVPVETAISTGPVPALRQLVHAAEDFPPYAVLVASQRDTTLWLIERQTWESEVQLEASLYPRKQQQGGWSQKRYQTRADERVEAFARTIAEELRVALGEGKGSVKYLILAAEEPMASALDAELHQTVKERIIGRVALPDEATVTQVVAVADPLVEEKERQLEMDAVRTVRDGVGAGTNGVAGAEATLTALLGGQVMTLVMNDDFAQAGWADFTLPLFGVGEVPKEHPAGGDVANIVPVELADEVIDLALQTNAAVELVRTTLPIAAQESGGVPPAGVAAPRYEAALALDALGGIGAILRYTIEEDRAEG
jgi:peptide subunit release factor 1 (eRF1)